MSLLQQCGRGGVCYDGGTDAINISFTIDGVTVTATSTRSPNDGNPPATVGIDDPTDGGVNYLSISATDQSQKDQLRESLGALFDNATLFSAYGGGSPAHSNAVSAIGSLSAVGCSPPNGLLVADA